MIRKIILTLLIIYSFNCFGGDILTDIDNAFMPVKDFKFKLELSDEKNGKIGKPTIYTTYTAAPDNCILVAVKPAIMAGNSMLRIDDTIYSYTKKIDRMSKTSAKMAFNDTLFTQEDILNTMFSTLYNVESSKEVVYEGKEVLKVVLQGKNKKVAYKTIVFYVDRVTLIPIVREYYSYSGKLIKKMIIEDIKYKDGKLDYLKIVMKDQIRTNRSSIAEFTDFEYIEVPKKYFTRSYMKILAR